MPSEGYFCNARNENAFSQSFLTAAYPLKCGAFDNWELCFVWRLIEVEKEQERGRVVCDCD